MKAEHRNKARIRLDEKFENFRPIERYSPPPKGWVRSIRDALGMSMRQLAKRMQMTAPSIQALEESEANGTIQINTLRRAAEALDCVVIYSVVPKIPLQKMVEDRARIRAIRALNRVSHSMALEDQQVDRDFEKRVQRYIDKAIDDRSLWD